MPSFPVGPNGRYTLPRRSREELRAYYYQHPCREVRELLWEVHRLRLLVLRANQLADSMGAGCANSTDLILRCLRQELEGEPVVQEHRAFTDELFDKPRR